MHTGATRADERPLDMHARDTAIRHGHSEMRGLGGTAHHLRPIGNDGGQQRSRAEGTMGPRNGERAFHRRRLIEHHATAAIHLHVDETGGEDAALG
jgi:hypothetical protein